MSKVDEFIKIFDLVKGHDQVVEKFKQAIREVIAEEIKKQNQTKQ